MCLSHKKALSISFLIFSKKTCASDSSLKNENTTRNHLITFTASIIETQHVPSSIYLTFFFSLLTKRQTHKTANTAVTAISPGHTGIGQTPVLISLSP